jgi:starch synthase
VGRLAEQKGIGLILRAADALAAEGIQVVLLGTGDQGLQDRVLGMGARHPGRFSVHVAFDTDLAHRIEAGCDLLLMPSLYEPCGLNQIYGLRYGTVPVVRATGGLADTVEDGRTGFVFEDYTVEAFVGAVRRALAVYADDRRWRAMMRAGMARDFSWDASARQYLELYESLARPGEP